MMPSRNDPCRCGSGKKYKACHLRADQEAARAARLLDEPGVREEVEERTAEAARRAPFWEADVAPLPGTFEDTGEAGALAMVVAGGLILGGDVLSRRPVGVQARARAVLDAVAAGGRRTGLLPERLHVRDDALAAALGPEMEARGISVAAAALPELDEALDASLEHLAGSAVGGAGSHPEVWAETEATPAELAELHAAAAQYHRAAPWARLSDADALLLRFPGDEQPWAASVMGGAGIHVGLALYSDPGDLAAMMEGDGSAGVLASLRGFTLSLSYDVAGDLPKGLRREVMSAGWEVAGRDAYPTLLGVNIPGRRLTAEHVRRTALACRAVAAFTEAMPDETPWRDPGSGVVMDLASPGEPAGSDHPWPLPEVAYPVGPAGRAADPAAALRANDDRDAFVKAEEDRLDRFARWLRRGSPSKAAADRAMRLAELWTDFLVHQRVPAQSATEYDLRTFLYEHLAFWDPPPKPVAKYLTRLIRELFQFYVQRERIAYPWAEEVLRELDELSAGAEDVRDVLEGLGQSLEVDTVLRVLRPQAEVRGTHFGWGMVADGASLRLRHELHRRWLMWHDEVVRSGITRLSDVRDVLIGRQREWENTPHPAHGGKTPRQVLLDQEVLLDSVVADAARKLASTLGLDR